MRDVEDFSVEERHLTLERALAAHHNHLEVRILEQVGQPQLGVEPDLLEELLVEQIHYDAVAGKLQEALEGTLEEEIKLK